jgi:hypothetical protein
MFVVGHHRSAFLLRPPSISWHLKSSACSRIQFPHSPT